jgi:hypothetical protein
MQVYYRDQTVEVTSTEIRVHDRMYRFDELTRIWHRRQAPSVRAVAGRGAWSMMLVLPVIAAVVSVVVAMRLDVTTSTRTTIVMVSILLGLGAALLLDPVLGKMDASFDRGVHVHEIWAERDGVPIRMLQTRDALRFGRIYRALERALES